MRRQDPAWPQIVHARTNGRTGRPVRPTHHTTGTAPKGHRNQRRTGRHPPGTHRTADTSPRGSYTPSRSSRTWHTPPAGQPSSAGRSPANRSSPGAGGAAFPWLRARCCSRVSPHPLLRAMGCPAGRGERAARCHRVSGQRSPDKEPAGLHCQELVGTALHGWPRPGRPRRAQSHRAIWPDRRPSHRAGCHPPRTGGQQPPVPCWRRWNPTILGR
jgi:hypothetical protein